MDINQQIKKHWFRILHSISLKYTFYFGGKRLLQDILRTYTGWSITLFIHLHMQLCLHPVSGEPLFWELKLKGDENQLYILQELSLLVPLKGPGINLGSGINLAPYQSWIQICRVNEIMSAHKAPTSAWHIVIANDTDDTKDNEFSLLIIFWTLKALHVWFHFNTTATLLSRQLSINAI